MGGTNRLAAGWSTRVRIALVTCSSGSCLSIDGQFHDADPATLAGLFTATRCNHLLRGNAVLNERLARPVGTLKRGAHLVGVVLGGVPFHHDLSARLRKCLGELR